MGEMKAMSDVNTGPGSGPGARMRAGWSGDGNHGIPGLSGDGNHGIPGLSGDGNHGVPGLAGSPIEGTLEGPADAFPILAQVPFRIEWWDPALRAQLVVAEFGAKFLEWRKEENGPGHVPKDGIAGEIGALLKRRAERLARQAEIIAQAAGFAEYWYRLLGADQGRRPATAAMIEVGIAIGHLAGMYWKAQRARPRPAHVYPTLLTTVPTPPHPSFPSNHALQSKLICLCLGKALPEPVAKALEAPMNAMAHRIAENREIAGVHYPTDTIASMTILAPRVFNVLTLKDARGSFDTTAFDTLCAAVKAEWEEWSNTDTIAPDRSGESSLSRPRPGGANPTPKVGAAS